MLIDNPPAAGAARTFLMLRATATPSGMQECRKYSVNGSQAVIFQS